MAFKEITTREHKGTVLVEASEETVITNVIVMNAEQIDARVAQLDAEKAKLLTLRSAIDAAVLAAEPTP